MAQKEIVWIGLNPSTADERKLDPTLRRIRSFSSRFGFNAFHMLNLFAFRATQPVAMKVAKDPVGPENDEWIQEVCKRRDTVVACWGVHGSFNGRDKEVRDLLKTQVLCLDVTNEFHPCHPLYLPRYAKLAPWKP